MRLVNKSYEAFNLRYSMCCAILDRMHKNNVLTDIQFKEYHTLLNDALDKENTIAYLDQIYEKLKNVYIKAFLETRQKIN